jgi:hypothetical protein
LASLSITLIQRPRSATRTTTNQTSISVRSNAIESSLPLEGKQPLWTKTTKGPRTGATRVSVALFVLEPYGSGFTYFDSKKPQLFIKVKGFL